MRRPSGGAEQVTEYLSYLPTGGILIVCVCLLKMMNGKLHSKVSRPECHDAQKAVNRRIDDFQKHMDERFEDMKGFIRNARQ